MKLAIVGSRDFKDYEYLKSLLDKHSKKVSLVISGGAKGADYLAERWAFRQGIDLLVHLPDWENHGKSAGFIRNERIVKDCDKLIAFWDGKSRGTKHSIDLCKKYGKQCVVVLYNQKVILEHSN